MDLRTRKNNNILLTYNCMCRFTKFGMINKSIDVNVVTKIFNYAGHFLKGPFLRCVDAAVHVTLTLFADLVKFQNLTVATVATVT